jgi:hypothetical protein
MTPEQEQLLDEAILRVLDEGDSQFGLGLTAILLLIGKFGFPRVTAELVTRRLDYMADTQISHVREVSRTANRAVRTWRITAAGTDRLRAQGV